MTETYASQVMQHHPQRPTLINKLLTKLFILRLEHSYIR